MTQHNTQTTTMRKRGRPAKIQTVNVEAVLFNPENIKTQRGKDMSFNDEIFKPLKSGSPLDELLSADGGIMPATNLLFVGGPGSGKTTVVLNTLAGLVDCGYKVLFISGEMDEVGFYKYCKRMPSFMKVETLFLKNYTATMTQTLEYVFDKGYDVVAIDSWAEIVEMYKEQHGGTGKEAESWLIQLQDHHKKGVSEHGYFTSFINIQQLTKGGEFAGTMRSKHMTDAMAEITVDKEGVIRTIQFSKNRDNSIHQQLEFTISDVVNFSYPTMKE
jgi:predicted ATP-dependent serine protease